MNRKIKTRQYTMQDGGRIYNSQQGMSYEMPVKNQTNPSLLQNLWAGISTVGKKLFTPDYTAEQEAYINSPEFRLKNDLEQLRFKYNTSGREKEYEQAKKDYIMQFNKQYNTKFQEGGSIDEMGYKDNSPYKGASMLNINTPTGEITMKGVSEPILGITDTETKMMMPNKEYKFNSNNVVEIPARRLKLRNSSMYQLNGKTGELEMPLQGDERIFSIEDTNKMMELSKSGDIAGLGKYFIQALNKQNKRK